MSISLINEYKSVHDLVNTLEVIQEEEWNRPIQEGKWSIREIIGHIYYWDKFNFENLLPRMKDQSQLAEFPDHDDFNQEAMKVIKVYNKQALLDVFLSTRVATANKLDMIDENVKFTIGEVQHSKYSFVKIFVEHDRYHFAQIRSYLNSLSG